MPLKVYEEFFIQKYKLTFLGSQSSSDVQGSVN